MAILLTIGLSIFLIASIVLLMFGPQIGSWIADLVGLGRAFEIAWNILRWPVILILVMTAVAAIYYFAPDVDQSWKWITPGSVLAVILWILISLGFSYYVNNFGSYDKTYGSIGAIIVLLTWMYVSGFVILVGGEINAVLEHASAEGKAPGKENWRLAHIWKLMCLHPACRHHLLSCMVLGTHLSLQRFTSDKRQQYSR